MSWQKVKLKEVINQIKDSVLIDNSKDYKLVTVSNKGVIKLREIVKGVEISANKAFVAKKGQFIYSRLSIHNGAFGIIPSELNGALVTSEMPLFEFKDIIIPAFFIYSLKNNSFKFQLEQLTKGVGRTRVKESSFLDLVIDLPSIEIQNLIVSKIKSHENESENISNELTHQLDLIKQLRQAFLREAMQGKLVGSAQLKVGSETGHDLLAKIKEEKAKLIAEKKLKKEKELPPITTDEIPFEIPEHWAWCRFEDICEIKSNLVNPDKYLKLPHIAPNHIEKNTGKLLVYQTVEEDELISAKHYFFPNQLLYSKVRPKLNKVVKVNFEGLCSADMYPLQPKINIDFMQKCMLSEYFLNEVDRFDNRVKMPKINQKQLSQIPIPLPPLHEQELIVAKLDELMAFCDGLEQSIKESQGYNEKLLQQVLREALQGGVIIEK